MMKKIRLIHWKPREAAGLIEWLEAAGYQVDATPVSGPEALKRLRNDPPDAIVIDLSRLPSHGRDVALALREYKPTRRVPLVFADGDPDKVARLRSLLPDASYTTYSRIRSELRRAIARPLLTPVVPPSRMAGYSGTPLARKLGIKAGSTVMLLDAPEGFLGTLADLPAGVQVVDKAGASFDLAIWFVRSQRELERKIAGTAALLAHGSLWIAWPKQGSALESDLTQQKVREAGLAAGLVDYKICAIDPTWSGLLFTRRRRMVRV